MITDITWKVKETVMFPNKYKVYPIRTGNRPIKESNGIIYFHPNIELAQQMANKLNNNQ